MPTSQKRQELFRAGSTGHFRGRPYLFQNCLEVTPRYGKTRTARSHILKSGRRGGPGCRFRLPGSRERREVSADQPLLPSARRSPNAATCELTTPCHPAGPIKAGMGGESNLRQETTESDDRGSRGRRCVGWIWPQHVPQSPEIAGRVARVARVGASIDPGHARFSADQPLLFSAHKSPKADARHGMDFPGHSSPL